VGFAFHRTGHAGLTLIAFAIVAGMTVQPAAAQTPLACGQVAAGIVAAPGERDVFTYFGEQGDVITLTIVETNPIDPGFLVSGLHYAPSGQIIGTIFAGTQNVTRLPETGMYRVHVFDFIGDKRGSYAFRIGWALPAGKQCGDRAPLACGQPASGTLATPLEHDIFTFFGQQGASVTLTLTQTGGFTQGIPFAQRISPSGELLGVLTTSFPTTMTLPETGLYVVDVHDNINTGVSSYTLQLGSPGSCPATPLPGAPVNLVASANGSTVSLTWSPPVTGGPVSSYVLEAGLSPGASNVTVIDTGSIATSLVAGGVPSGTYFIRVKAKNAAGTSAASNEVALVVGTPPAGCTAPPSPPGGLVATVNGNTVALTWSAAGGIVSNYLVQAGSSSGASNLATLSLGAQTTSLSALAPPGTYFVRVRAQNTCGVSGASNEVVVTMP
jgi:hypothetical protein